jgi:hypothetical protein
MPTDTGLPSVKARAGLWHVAQATVPFPESRDSKNSFSPNAALAGVSVVGEMTYWVKTVGKPT